MLKNPVLFHAFNIDWTVFKAMLAVGFLCMLIGLSFGLYILKRAGHERALNEEELETLGRTPDGNPVRMHWAGAKGSRVEARADVQTLRSAAERGDWAMFWAWPCSIVSWSSGFALIFSSLAILDPEAWWVPVFLGGMPCFLFAAVGLFMPWAALYTNIGKPKNP
jgi:hypothetical protein